MLVASLRPLRGLPALTACAHFAHPVTVEEMAGAVQMRAASFHQRFKVVTTMSPLQYQKALRLHEARRLMLFQNVDARRACHQVGYVSPSQIQQRVRALLRQRAHEGYCTTRRRSVRADTMMTSGFMPAVSRPHVDAHVGRPRPASRVFPVTSTA
jgi:AraC-like DNA-binding protein